MPSKVQNDGDEGGQETKFWSYVIYKSIHFTFLCGQLIHFFSLFKCYPQPLLLFYLVVTFFISFINRAMRNLHHS